MSSTFSLHFFLFTVTSQGATASPSYHSDSPGGWHFKRHEPTTALPQILSCSHSFCSNASCVVHMRWFNNPNLCISETMKLC